MKTNFEKAAFYNNLIGNAKGFKGDFDNSVVQAQLSLINEEVDELNAGCDVESIEEVRDAIGDILVVVYGLAHRMGIDADKDFNIVHKSNMSKFCIDQVEAVRTMDKYGELGLDVDLVGDFPEASVVSSKDQRDNNYKFYKQGKQLKSINWKGPKFK